MVVSFAGKVAYKTEEDASNMIYQRYSGNMVLSRADALVHVEAENYIMYITTTQSKSREIDC